MTAKSKYAFELKNRLKKAIEEREFVLFYQPKVSIYTNKIVGAEALIRWIHPEKGLIPPNDFIHIAEYSGLIKQIGEWVIEEACRQVREWKNKGFPEITVSVNVSSIQFQDNDLKKQVEINLKKSNISPQQIELELTETIIMKDSETAMEILNALKAMNILLSIDDFGTGYSSHS
jgi:EAL domain-containing protein (putative c-di-GMP-specific phosphodiesterase class I)